MNNKYSGTNLIEFKKFEIASDFSIHFNTRAVLLLSGVSRMFSLFQNRSIVLFHLFQPSMSHQNLQKRLLRYISRRKPCKYLLFIQFGILALLTGFFIPVMLLLDNSRKQLAVMKAEHRIYQTYVGSITLTHCHYLYPQKSEVHTINNSLFSTTSTTKMNTHFYVKLLVTLSQELCDKQCGSSAYIVLRYENSLGNKMESTCPSLIQTAKSLLLLQVPCHEKPARCNQKLQLRQCPGVNGIYLLKNLSITPLTIFKVGLILMNSGEVPKIYTSLLQYPVPLLNISTMKGEIVSALELFAVCPRCRIYSHSYNNKHIFFCRKSDNTCYRQLETVREGWPEQYRVCDSEVLSENKICNPYDAL
ncbi:unnamed protein product [Brugia timori]|uniref:Transmembrane protein n=1 Tax=Brugia timori TaxID=42155 RepID=A0A0R3QU20_9BILA|nr:unnamed protein product [Brugia timori]